MLKVYTFIYVKMKIKTKNNENLLKKTGCDN